MNRREFLSIGAGSLVAGSERTRPTFQQRTRLPSDPDLYAVGMDGNRIDHVEILCTWSGTLCRLRAINRGPSVRIKEIVVANERAVVSPDTAIYGEGFQMLTQTAGTIAAPADLSQYTDAKHYRIPAPAGTRSYYGLLTITPPSADTRLFAFTSCARFSGRFQIDPGYQVKAIVDTEGLELRARETWPIEELMIASGSDRSRLLADVAKRLATQHPPLKTTAPPTGWCSWYCFGPRVTAKQILDNLDAIAKQFPSLKYVQIDDGYQSAMGDWLSTGAAFGGNVRAVLDQIRRRGFQPAIWVAPFVAEESSTLFKEHPDWFIKDDTRAPLRSDRVTFGGWRRGPWYALDGTNPSAQDHLERLFRTMRNEWGCTYFKLDANFWGAMHGGRFHDPGATRIEAYRRGMAAILRGSGDAFILGCNHPIWPSIGVIHGSRSSNDIRRSWDRVATTARQNLNRNWQNGTLWWNDPDAVVVSGELSDSEAQFHATAIYACGGMVLSGDDLTGISPGRAAMLRKLLPPTGVAAAFEDATLRIGIVRLPRSRVACFFNWEDAPRTLSMRLDRATTVVDHWSDRALGRHEGTLSIEMAPRSARLFKLTP